MMRNPKNENYKNKMEKQMINLQRDIMKKNQIIENLQQESKIIEEVHNKPKSFKDRIKSLF